MWSSTPSTNRIETPHVHRKINSHVPFYWPNLIDKSVYMTFLINSQTVTPKAPNSSALVFNHVWLYGMGSHTKGFASSRRIT